jgi:hypothetical protein
MKFMVLVIVSGDGRGRVAIDGETGGTEPTRCRAFKRGCPRSRVATRAEWRVEFEPSCSADKTTRVSCCVTDKDDVEGTERCDDDRVVVGGVLTEVGFESVVEVELDVVEGVGLVSDDGAVVGGAMAAEGTPVNPWAIKAFMTASQPFSRVLILCFNSSVSRSRSRSRCTRSSSSIDLTVMTWGTAAGVGAGTAVRGVAETVGRWRPGGGSVPGAGATGRPARSLLFSSSNSLTRRSSQEN